VNHAKDPPMGMTGGDGLELIGGPDETPWVVAGTAESARPADDGALVRWRSDWAPRSFLARSTALRAYVEAGAVEQFAPGVCVVEEGADDSRVHLLLSACVKVTASIDGARYSLLGVRRGGDVVGELAALDDAPPVATVRVCGRGPAVALVLEREAFRRVILQHPDDAVLLSAKISEKLRAATRRRVDFTGFPPRVRLARVLVELAEDHGHRAYGQDVVIGVNLTQVELGTVIGVSEITAQRALRALREDGLVVTDGPRPIVRDLTSLRRMAGLV
jgi:CRP/FNR family cyclic AMP-dependent transcriptional regulator